MRALLGLVVSLAVAGQAQATVFHVSPTGSDSDDGSAATPWKTLGHCAALAQPGDTCRAHTGTYRESITPPRSGTPVAHIRFEAAPGECAIVSGAEPLAASWQVYSGAIYVASTTAQFVQMFSSSNALGEARWPNANPDDLVHMPFARAAAGTDMNSLYAAGLPIGDWTGAVVWMMPGARWWSYTRNVTTFDPMTNKLTFDSPVNDGEGTPRRDTPFFVFGSLAALDAPGEWFLDTTQHKLYLWAPGGVDPSTLTVETKQRAWAFDVSNKSYVDIAGFEVFASAIRLENASHCTVDGIQSRYPSHARALDGIVYPAEENTISGDHDTWKNSVISQSAGAGLSFRGSDHLIINNIIHDVNYLGTNQGGIDLNALWDTNQRDVLAYNTVTRAGRAGIMIVGLQTSHVLFNKIDSVVLQTDDMGGIDTWDTDGMNTEIAYNEISNVHGLYGAGVYLDDESKNFIVHHNYVHDLSAFGFTLKDQNAFFNNTIRNAGEMPIQIGLDQIAHAWGNVGASFLANNLDDGATGMTFELLPSTVTDYGAFTAAFVATSEWSHVTIPFSTLAQSTYANPATLDLTHITNVTFQQKTSGDYDLEIDNVRLEGPTPKLVSDFASGMTSTLGATWYAFGGNGTTATSSGVEATCGNRVAEITGTDQLGGYMGMALAFGPTADLSAYTAISLDIRARSRFVVSTLGPPPIVPLQGANFACPTDATGAPPTTSCALAQGVAISPYTDGFVGAAPDLGAFPSGAAAWVAGARFTENLTCTPPPDLVFAMPGAATYPATPTTLPQRPPLVPGDWNVSACGGDGTAMPDAGMPDAASATPDARSGSPDNPSNQPSGCGCESGNLQGPYGLAAMAVAVMLCLRRRRRH